ncbi:RecF/RecN/SMC [Lipomyces japonicus]|uniref:RecF/RecN/SMC n=1 Tax=Lipomyces japonicus TaxID=56871 RepID=UPI0034CE565E
MRLDELIIDGFKSYATRTVISGWDSSFNCITGLNGSGKSNILDAICFVLGITTMSTVRAQSLQDLIYKRGQAGVTKASVTIVFDNSDTAKSPIGFENSPQISVTRQIVLGGTSKYLINGHRAQQQTVQNLFQSIQLNINNPNFLIMQGRITKVLNMKATEILAMIEEASGTRMFEDRRDKALKTMSKKDKKVEEINELLQEEIEPKLEKLRIEKRSFLELQKTQTDLERITRIVVSHDYLRYNDVLHEFDQKIEKKASEISAIENVIAKTKSEVALIEEDISRVIALREKELQKGDQYQKMEQVLKKTSHEVVRLTTLLELKTKNIVEEEAKGELFLQSINELQAQLAEKAKEYEGKELSYRTLKESHARLLAEASSKEELLETLRTGVASKEGQKNGFLDQLEQARADASQGKSRQEQVKLEIAHLQKQSKELTPKARKAEQQNLGLLSKVDSLKQECAALEQNLADLQFDPKAHEDLKQKKVKIDTRIRELSMKIDGLKRQVSNIDFNYDNPTTNFDRSKVKGLVAQLFFLEESKFECSTALEICAGGRLFNVVVDNEITGTQLLENGRLRKRVTIIPLNKISAFKASAEKLGAAKNIAPGKVDLALSLVGYDEEVARAMEYVFGSTLICADSETAKKVTFDPRVRMRSVTFQGDLYDPNGTLSGGSAPNTTGILIKIQELNHLTAELTNEKTFLAKLKDMMASEVTRIERGTKISQQLDLKKHEVVLMEQQIANNSSTSLLSELQKILEKIKNLEQQLQAARDAEVQANQNILRIEKDMAEFKSNKGSKLELLKSELGSLKSKAEIQSKDLKIAQKDYQSSQIEKDQVDADILSAQSSFQDAKQTWKDLNAELSELKSVLEAENLKQKEISELVEKEKAKLLGFDEEISVLQDTKRTKSQNIEDDALEVQKGSHEMDKMRTDRKQAKNRLAELANQFGWVNEEKGLFGKTGSPYDFSGYNITECKSTMKQLTDRYNEMKKTVNGKVMNMIDNVEKKEASLCTMLKTIDKDKRKIEETIATLDEYKKEALIKTWQKVNEDFGHIFADMLPGSFAKLEPPEGKEVTDGLEVKVCLGKIWKESLAELSGGQRSLVALSLIMALLQFKPAPMYILDEVDAALDLSHTQNIGKLIKTRFKGSQFIVVSLKDGLFSNANKVFRTRFQEGSSVVSVM